MLKKGVSGKHRVVWLNNGCGDLWRWIYGETKLGFLTIVDGKSLEEKRTKSGSSTTTNSVEDEETLETSALISELSNSIKAEIDDFFTNSIVTSGEVVSCILLSRDELLWMEELSVSSGSNFIDDGWLKIKEYSSWNMLSSTSLREEGVESIITATNGFIGWHLTIWLDSVLKAEEFPACVTDLDTGLSNMD